MYHRFGIPVIIVAMMMSASALGQNYDYDDDDDLSDRDELKITALEALMSAPPERALPAVRKVLEGDSSDEVKESALLASVNAC